MTSDRPIRPPAALLVALLLLLVEVGALLALTVGMLLEVVRGQSTGGAVTAVLAAMFIGLCAVLVAAGRALYRRHRWGRGPVVTWQLLLLATAVSQADGLEWWVVALLVAFPVAVTAGILVPRSVEWTNSATPPRAVA